MSAAHRLGRRGERAAVRALKRQGYRILGRNMRTPAAEVDIVALHELAPHEVAPEDRALDARRTVLVVVEVKTRRQATRDPQVPRRQQQRLLGAARWLANQPSMRTAAGAPCGFRVDYALVTLDGRRFVVTIRRDMVHRNARQP